MANRAIGGTHSSSTVRNRWRSNSVLSASAALGNDACCEAFIRTDVPPRRTNLTTNRAGTTRRNVTRRQIAPGTTGCDATLRAAPACRPVLRSHLRFRKALWVNEARDGLQGLGDARAGAQELVGTVAIDAPVADGRHGREVVP